MISHKLLENMKFGIHMKLPRRAICVHIPKKIGSKGCRVLQILQNNLTEMLRNCDTGWIPNPNQR